MMKISRKHLETFVSITGTLVPECRLMITDQGWNTLAVDTANVAMVSVNMPKDLFDTFDGEAKGEIGMDVQKWKNMLAVMADKDGTIVIDRKTAGETGKISATDGKYTYTLALLDANTVRKRPNPPNINLPASIRLEAVEVNETLKAMAVIGDRVRFAVTRDGLVLDAQGDTDHLKKSIQVLEGSTLPETNVSSTFSLDYLRDIGKAMKDAGTLTLHVGHDHPIRFDFEADGLECSYLLAPRIGEGEE